MPEDIYKTIEKPSEGIYKEKGSKFLAFAYPISNEEEFKTIQKSIEKKYHDARHRCFAYRLGAEKNIFRSNDDGEPSNSAGKPILGQIVAFDLTNVLIYVVRYFGGTLLGVGGLINAYKTASKDALQKALIITKFVQEAYQINFNYDAINDIMRVIKENNLCLIDQNYGENCTLRFLIKKKDTTDVLKKFNKFDNVNINYLYDI